jgi:NADH:ubiquinone oxidoreductase subunit E
MLALSAVDPGPFRSPAWSQITRHRRQVLVCRGPRCTAYGANQVAAALSERLAKNGLGDDDVLVTATGCLFPCNLGPQPPVRSAGNSGVR